MKVFRSSLTAVGFLLLAQGCAGSAPDYSLRNPLVAQEARLAQFFDSEETPERTISIAVPVCSSSVGTAKSGWNIDDGNWCVTVCDSTGMDENRWMKTPEGNRCLLTAIHNAAAPVTVEFGWADLSLKQLPVFDGFSRSFLVDTEWECQEYRYQIDSGSSLGFWDELKDKSILYRFHRDGRLVIGADTQSARPSGTWSVREDSRVFFNRREVFRHAIDYGGGRFDDFITSRDKQICRFVREAHEVER